MSSWIYLPLKKKTNLENQIVEQCNLTVGYTVPLIGLISLFAFLPQT